MEPDFGSWQSPDISRSHLYHGSIAWTPPTAIYGAYTVYLCLSHLQVPSQWLILQWRHMSVVQSQITIHSSVFSRAYSGWWQQQKNQSTALLALCEGNPPVTDGFLSQRASNGESISVSWLHQYNCRFMMGHRRRTQHCCLRDVEIWLDPSLPQVPRTRCTSTWDQMAPSVPMDFRLDTSQVYFLRISPKILTLWCGLSPWWP